MGLNKQLRFAVRFTNFCTTYGVKPLQLAEMIQLQKTIFNQEVNYANTGKEYSDTERGKLEALAHDGGFTVDFSSAYPQLYKSDYQIFLPSED